MTKIRTNMLLLLPSSTKTMAKMATTEISTNPSIDSPHSKARSVPALDNCDFDCSLHPPLLAPATTNCLMTDVI